MTGMGLDEAVEELYGSPLPEFVARRNALVAQAKATGAAELARTIGALRKPTVSAWALNQLARHRPHHLDQVAELAEAMRAAQQSLDATAMKTLAPQRLQLLDEAAAWATSVARDAGVTLSAAAIREVRETVVAALASTEATAAVVSGQLTRALSYAGFGEVDLHDALARPLHAVPDLPAAQRHRSRPAGAERRPVGQPPLVQLLAVPSPQLPAPAEPAPPTPSTEAPARPAETSARSEQESARSEQESARSEQESARTEQESARTEQESARAEQESARAEADRAEHRLAEVVTRRGVLAGSLELAETRVASLTRELGAARAARDAAEAALGALDAEVLVAERTARRARAQRAALEPDAD